jgi:hypothetical protein
VHGAGEVENAPLPGRDHRASDGEVRGFAGDRFRAALLSQGSRAQPLRRQEHPERCPGPSYGAQAQVEGDGGCGGPGNRPEHPHSRRDVVAGPVFRQGWRFRCEAEVDSRASGGPKWTRGPRGDEVRASGRDPWHGVRRTCADPARLHGGATARGQRAAGTRYRLPARTDSEGKVHCEEGPGSPGRRAEQSASNEGEWSPKHSEPQGRQWDATSPRPDARRNPSRWSETTRADRDFIGLAAMGPKEGASLPGVDVQTGCRRRGAANPKRGGAERAPERSGESLEGEAKGGWSARQALRSRSTFAAGRVLGVRAERPTDVEGGSRRPTSDPWRRADEERETNPRRSPRAESTPWSVGDRETGCPTTSSSRTSEGTHTWRRHLAEGFLDLLDHNPSLRARTIPARLLPCVPIEEAE